MEYVPTDTLTEYITKRFIDVTQVPGGEAPEAPGCSVFVPNTFTPNNDGWNDSFYAVTEGNCWDEELSIYNDGVTVYGQRRTSTRWYGQVNSGEHYASDGVYVGHQAQGPGESLDLQGTVTCFVEVTLDDFIYGVLNISFVASIVIMMFVGTFDFLAFVEHNDCCTTTI